MWMTTKLAECASELRQITKIRPSDASGKKHSNGGAICVWSERIWRLSGKCRSISPGDGVVAFHRPLNINVPRVAPEFILQLDPGQLGVGVTMAIELDVLGLIKAPNENREETWCFPVKLIASNLKKDDYI